MALNLVVHPEDVIASLSAVTKDDILKELAVRAEERHPGLDAAHLTTVLLERERLGSTGIGDGIAIPHGKLKQVKDIICVFGRSIDGVDFNALDSKKVHLFFLLVAPDEAVGIHLKMLARISRLLKDATTRARLLAAEDASAISSIIRGQDKRH